MNKLTACLTTALALISLANASATVVFTYDPNANRVVNGNLATYSLSFTSPGAQIAGFQGNFSGQPGHNAFSGPMLQQLAGGSPTPTKDSNGSIDASLDTQFLVLNSEILSAVAPFESSTTLGGAFTLNIAARAQTKTLVQVVANKDAKVFYDFVVFDNTIEGYYPFQGVLGVPEPSSLALATLGIVAASLARTCRRRI
jgi:hypothetical protein